MLKPFLGFFFAALLLLSIMWPFAQRSYAQSSIPETPSPSKPNAAGNSSGSTVTRPADQSKEITAFGCIKGNSAAFFSDSGDFGLVGNDDEINRYGDDWVRIRGKVLPDQQLQVLSISKLSEAPHAILDIALREPSRWQTYSNDEVGIRFSLPKESRPLAKDDTEGWLAPSFIERGVVEVLHSDIPREIYQAQKYRGKQLSGIQTENPPLPNFSGANFAIFVSSSIKDAATCRKFNPDPDGKTSTRTINRINYAVLQSYSGSAGGADDLVYFHTFQNGRCFAIAFDLSFFSEGPVDISCSIEYADGNLLENLLLSKISFFQPKATVATTIH
jgi:hypothetical protein